MKTPQRVLLFFILPLIGPLLYPPETLLPGLLAVVIAVVVFVAIGIFLWQGKQLALTFSIFLQGFNVIVRLLMFFSTSVTLVGGKPTVDLLYIILSVLSISLSMWVLLRLDRMDIHAQMTG
jgi:hypothetical protein